MWSKCTALWRCSDSPHRMLPHKFFLWHFLSVPFHMCFLSSAPTRCSPPNFHRQSPPTHNFTRSHTPRVLDTFEPPLTFSVHIMEKKTDFLKKGHKVHVKDLVFLSTFSSLRSPPSCFCTWRNKHICSLFACGTPKPFLPVDWFSHQKFLIMSQ